MIEQQMSADNRRVKDFQCQYTDKAGFIPSSSENYDNVCVEIARGGKGNVISQPYYFKEENNLINQLRPTISNRPGAGQEDKEQESAPQCCM